MTPDAPAQGVLRAPAAVRMVDIEGAEDLRVSRAGTPYASAYLVATRGGRPLAARTLVVDADGLISAEAIRLLFADVPSNPPASPAAPPVLPKLSVVVTTCGKDESVSQAVASVLACDPGPLEVIVVENRPRNSTVAATLQERFGADSRLRCVSEPRVGLSHARNAGLAVAVGDAVAFTDDDVVVDRKWVEWLARGFAGDRDVACVTGLILPADLETASQVQIEQFAGFGKGWERRIFRIDNPTSALFPYAAGEFGSGACTALRRDVANELGGFATELGAGTRARGGEDLDLFVRVLVAGHVLVYEPAAVIWHHHPDVAQHLRKELFSYGVGLSAMMTKQMLEGHARAILRRVPAGLRFVRDPESRKNVRKGPAYPKYFDWIERAGFVAGPLAYLASRRQQRRLARAAAAATPPLTPTA
jgi:GT2 family glycosyltransferase